MTDANPGDMLIVDPDGYVRRSVALDRLLLAARDVIFLWEASVISMPGAERALRDALREVDRERGANVSLPSGADPGLQKPEPEHQVSGSNFVGGGSKHPDAATTFRESLACKK